MLIEQSSAQSTIFTPTSGANLNKSKPAMTQREERNLERLQELLLQNEREKIEQLRAILDDRARLAEKVNPIIREHLEELKREFPKDFETEIDRLIEEKLKNSQEDILNIIYPKLGKMIQKYIGHQFQQLKESIDNQIENTLNAGPIGWVRRKVLGLKTSEVILSEIDKPVVEEIYVIQRDSGLLIAHASLHEKVNQDLVAGMLTAIKAFAEDAFQQEQADLDRIAYGNYTLSLQSFHSYYIAVATTGSLSAAQRQQLSQDLLTFAEQEMNKTVREVNSATTIQIKEALDAYFIKPQRDLLK